MANLDYAFLADYARVEPNGTLTSIGASFTYVNAQSLPTNHRMAVAGRVRARIEERDIQLGVELVGPNESYVLRAGAELNPGDNVRPYGEERFVGHLFALDVQVPLPSAGVYLINLSLAGEHVRTLAFDAQEATPES